MLNIIFKVSVRQKACTHTQKMRAPQASNGTDTGLKSRKRTTCKRAFSWNDLDQFWLNFDQNNHIFLANARKSSSFIDQNVGNEEKQMRIQYLVLIYFFSGLLRCHSWINYEAYLPSACRCVDEHCLTNSTQEFITFWVRGHQDPTRFFNPYHLNVFESIN